jgi:hypothetical protein
MFDLKKGDIFLCKKSYKNVSGSYVVEKGKKYYIFEIFKNRIFLQEWTESIKMYMILDPNILQYSSEHKFEVNDKDPKSKFYINNFFHTPIDQIKKKVEDNFKHHVKSRKHIKV